MSIKVLIVSKDLEYYRCYGDHIDFALTHDEFYRKVAAKKYDLIIWELDTIVQVPYAFFKCNFKNRVWAIAAKGKTEFNFIEALNSGVSLYIDKSGSKISQNSSFLQVIQMSKRAKWERKLLDQYRVSTYAKQRLLKNYRLSTREIEVVDCCLDACDYAQIATRLYISKGTVKRHLHNIYQKLGFSCRADLKDFIYKLNRNEITPFQNFYSMT